MRGQGRYHFKKNNVNERKPTNLFYLVHFSKRLHVS